MKKNDMGWTCGTNWRQERCIQGWWGDLTEGDHLEDVGIE